MIQLKRKVQLLLLFFVESQGGAFAAAALVALFHVLLLLLFFGACWHSSTFGLQQKNGTLAGVNAAPGVSAENCHVFRQWHRRCPEVSILVTSLVDRSKIGLKRQRLCLESACGSRNQTVSNTFTTFQQLRAFLSCSARIKSAGTLVVKKWPIHADMS